ncbi:hypothetical protein VTO42DRAFT_5935 [Malbranchea cinnamomea]
MSSKSSRTSHCMPVALAKDGRYVAVVNANYLNIIQLLDGQVIISTPVHDNVKGRMRYLQWAKCGSGLSGSDSVIDSYCHRLLCASGNHISVRDVHDEGWSAEINAGDGTNFSHVDFAARPNEVIAITEFGVQLSIFLLETGEQRIIKSPKFSNPMTYAIRPTTGHLATILKVDASDVLVVHELETYEPITTSALPTVDAQGLKWSPNGSWLAVWDAASAGTRIAIYTADGQHFRTYSGDPEMAATDFGVKTVEWSPDSALLAIGKHDGTIDLVNGRTFTLVHVLDDPISIRPIGRDIYLEQPASHGQINEYMLAPESPVFPFSYNVPSCNRAVSTISFNPSGSLVATVDHGLPHIVWMWSLKEKSPRLAGALIQKASIRQLLWNPDLPELLMTTNDDDSVSVHQWICGHVPRIAPVSQVGSGRHHATWLHSSEKPSGLIWVGSHSGYVIGCIEGTRASATFNQLSCLQDAHRALSADDFPPT